MIRLLNFLKLSIILTMIFLGIIILTIRVDGLRARHEKIMEQQLETDALFYSESPSAVEASHLLKIKLQ